MIINYWWIIISLYYNHRYLMCNSPMDQIIDIHTANDLLYTSILYPKDTDYKPGY